MTSSHLAHIEALSGEGKASLLTDFVEGDDAGDAIPDPIGAPPEVYAEVRHRIERGVEALLDRLSSILAP